MNHYSFSDCYVGMKTEFKVQVTGEKMNMFREITGDLNPLHSDETFAQNHNYKGKVAFGLLTAAFTSTLAGVHIPGEQSLIHEVSYKFIKPVYVGDELSIFGEIVEVDERTKQLMLKIKARRVADEVLVLRGKMIVGFLGE